MKLKEATVQLAKAMALEAANSKDIRTTSEGRGMLPHLYKVAHTMLEEVVDIYLKKV